jgi:hypothetical protein
MAHQALPNELPLWRRAVWRAATLSTEKDIIMSSIPFDDAMRRAQEAAEAARAKLKSIWLDFLKSAVCIIIIIGAAYTEVISATIAINAAYPVMSDGTSQADAIMGLRYSLAFYALLGHVLISSVTGRMAAGVNWLLGLVGLIALIIMLFGMGLFSFSGTALTLNSDGEASGLFGLISGMAGPALGMVCASLFIISFLAAHVLAGKLLGALAVLSAAFSDRSKVARLDCGISEANALAAQIESARRVVDEMAAPGALVRKVAAEAARIVGNVTSQAHEAVMTKRAFEGVDLNDSDEVPAHLRDIPLSLLEQMLADLKQYTPAYFINLLTKGE